MVHLYPQVTKPSELFDVESAFKGVNGINKNEDKKKESIENGGAVRNENTAQANDKTTDDRKRKCLLLFLTWIVPFILIFSVGAYLGYNYEQRIQDLTEANRICQASKTEQEDRFNQVIAQYEQNSMDYVNEIENYARRMDEKLRNAGATTEERQLPKKGDVYAYDMEDYGGYSETKPVSEPHTEYEIRIIHISNRGTNGKYGFWYRNTYITYVRPGSPADLNDVKEGDEIIRIDGVKVETEEDVTRLGFLETGITLELRSVNSLPDPPTRTVTKAPVPRAQTRFVTMQRSDVGGWEGIYGFNHSGTTITSVVPGSSMDRNGVKMGDEIVSINGVLVHTNEDIAKQIQEGNYATFAIRPHP